MITIVNIYNRLNEYRGLSTDEKPIVDVVNGSTFLEMDTGNVFMFDDSIADWRKL